MIGAAYGLSSPVRTFSPTLYVEASLEPGASLELPDSVSERGLYLVSGEVKLHDRVIAPQQMVVFDQSTGLNITATAPTRLAIIGGEPVGKRKVWWNFVSSRPERIEQAKQDWIEGRFDKVPGETEFIPLPE